ncbi:MAG: GerMN domain-containing protein [Lachnospiraceae bacterium]|nr:GerMN domain-containing protein [Lachnospiraceae bacterium]
MSLVRKLLIAAALMITALFLTACSDGQEAVSDAQTQATEDTFKIFRTDVTESSLLWESGEAPDESLGKIEQVRKVLDELASTPREKEMKKLLPGSVTMDSAYFGRDGQLIISFSKSYNSLSTVTELLLRAGYVKTLCQLGFVDYVEFYVEETPLILRGEVIPGLMKQTDFVDNTGDTTYFRQEVELTLYFVKSSEKMLGSGIYIVTYDGSSSYEELVSRLLVRGPEEGDTEFIPTLPEGTVINKITSSDGIVYVDVNEEFLNYRENIGEELTVYSLVNSLCELQGIMKVQITVNGTTRKAFEKYGQGGFIERRPDLIASEKAGEADG